MLLSFSRPAVSCGHTFLLVSILLLVPTNGNAIVFAEPAVSDTFSKMPAGWQVDRQIVVPAGQLSGFSSKLGGEISKATNTFIGDTAGRKLQINELTCASSEDCEKVYKTLMAIKGNPRSLIRRKNTIFEFVYQTEEQARFAAEARYRLPLQPAKVVYQVKFKAVPLASGNAMAWNRLHNAFLQYEKTPTPVVDRRVQELASEFQFGSQLSLRKFGLGANASSWTLSPELELLPQVDEAQLLYELEDSSESAGIPKVEIEGVVTCENFGVTQVPAETSTDSFLAPTSAWPVDDKQIQQLALETIENAQNDREKLFALLGWFANPENVKPGGSVGSRYGVKQVLVQKFGNCWDYSDLFITMCRAAGLPARQVFGWLVPGEGHVWCEVRVGDRWQHVDPTTGTGCGSDYVPFFLSLEGEFPPVYASTVSIVPKAD